MTIKANSNDKRDWKDYPWLLISILTAVFLVSVTVYRIGAWYQCLRNIEDISVACEIYSNSIGNGYYPDHISQLKPYFIKELPQCPSTGRDSYSQAYESNRNPDSFTIYCKGCNHPLIAGFEGDHPIYSAWKGQILNKREEKYRNFIENEILIFPDLNKWKLKYH